MRFSEAFIPTLKEAPQEAEIPSHRLLLRAGYIRKVASGVYEWLPLGMRVLRKVIDIIREEMEAAGAQEVLLPVLTPAELWRETGRWEKYGAELMRLKDRHERDFALGPTHEEVVTDLVRRELKSHKQLPWNLYQIAVKFRDEIRPRFGVMRSREFLMKDGYSFDKSEEDARRTYERMKKAYARLFGRMGLKTLAVEADAGLIGGSVNHEFMVLSDVGEGEIVVCEGCGKAANVEAASGKPTDPPVRSEALPIEEKETPNRHTVEEVAAFLGVSPSQLIKTMIIESPEGRAAVLIRGDHELNLTAVQRHLGWEHAALATEKTVREVTGAPLGFAGPVGLRGIPVLADEALKGGHDWVTGGCKKDVHLIHVEIGRDFPEPIFGCFRKITSGETCLECGGRLQLRRGIEVGHTFYLGTRYSKAMHCVFLNESGKEQEAVMGCFGIGVTRLPAAVVEQNHDDAGIRWPIAVSPYHVHLLLLNPDDPEVLRVAEAFYDQWRSRNVEVLFDERVGVSAGAKFKDADLLGLPLQVRVGQRGLREGEVEIYLRRTGEVEKVPRDKVFERLQQRLHEEWRRCEARDGSGDF